MSPSKPSSEWTQCEQGALRGAVRQASRRQRWRRLAPAGAAIGVVLVLFAALSMPGFWRQADPPFTPPTNVEYYYGGIACSEVVGQRQEYAKGDLDASLRARIDEHLSACPKCRRVYEDRVGTTAGRRMPDPGLAVVVPFPVE
jgi:hypothetical protein